MASPPPPVFTGVSTDTGNLFSASLPWRQRTMSLDRAFPQQQDLLVAVVDGATPEEADATAAALATARSHDTRHFKGVQRPVEEGDGPWVQDRSS